MNEDRDARPGRLMRWPVFAFGVLAVLLTASALALQGIVPSTPASPYAVTDFAYSPDGRTALRAGNDGTLRVIEAESERPLTRIEGLEAPIVRAAYTRSGRHAIVASPERISIVDVFSGAVIRSFRVSHTLAAMAVSPDDSMLSALGSDNKVRIYRTDGDLLATIESASSGAIHGTTWCPHDCLLVWGEEGMLEVWNPRKPALLANMGWHRRDIRAAVFSPDGQRLGTIDDERSVLIWYATPASPRILLPSLDERPIALAWSRDRSMIAVETETGKAYIWSLDGYVQPVVIGPKDGVGQGWLAFSPSGRSIVLGSWPDGVRRTQIPKEDWEESEERSEDWPMPRKSYAPLPAK